MRKLSATGKVVLSVFAIIAVAVLGNSVLPDKLSGSILGNLDSDTYQGINLDNGETYFGKVTEITDKSVTLTDVYYFKAGDKTKLIKKSGQIYGSDDSIVINLTKVISKENLLPDGKVMQAIKQYESGK